MANLNKAILIGRLTADPELRQTPTGVNVTSFTVAVDRRGKSGEDKQTDFIPCVAWRTTADFIARYFKKGNSIGLCGQIQVRSYNDRNGTKKYATEVICDEAFFVESKSAQPATNVNPAEAYVPEAYTSAPSFEDVTSEPDLPF